jgi:cysteinyl-tRNA synthetase
MLQLLNTMSRKKETFTPLFDRKVKMFTCGPSIYRRPHIGNYRTFLWEDVLQRYLGYLGYDVERVINLTDVEDKAVAEAREEGQSVQELTNRAAERFFQETRLLGIELPAVIPRSSTSVDQAVVLIKMLLEKGVAYRYGKDIFFDPLKFEGFGKLFRLDMSRWPKKKRRFKKDTYPGTRWNLGDFILWHGYTEGDDVFWEADIGKGRPSWNIQDPAMITKHLGYRVDISCGGVDNLYRHHDYNLAVIESISGEEFAKYWVHGEHLLVGGKKMSKSLGNILYPEDLMKQGYSPQHIRFYLLYGHHRKTMNLTEERLKEGARKLDDFRRMFASLRPSSSGSKGSAGRLYDNQGLIEALPREFERYMSDDLQIKSAFDAMTEILSKLVKASNEGALGREDYEKIESSLRQVDGVLQVLFE